MTYMITSYELLYIIPATFTDDDVSRIELQVKGLLEKYGATIDSTSRLGKFRFAYPIKQVRHGHYVMVHWSGETSSVRPIDEALRISTEVLRYLILRSDEAGGDKFDLVQFTEINLDNKDVSDDRSRRPRGDKVDERKAEIKSGVAVLEASGEEEGAKDKVVAKELTPEELEKKIESALKEDT